MGVRLEPMRDKRGEADEGQRLNPSSAGTCSLARGNVPPKSSVLPESIGCAYYTSQRLFLDCSLSPLNQWFAEIPHWSTGEVAGLLVNHPSGCRQDQLSLNQSQRNTEITIPAPKIWIELHIPILYGCLP
jgi:hypothetical protein